jgi:hypothetical protein
MKILVEVSLSDKNGQVCVVREIFYSEYFIGTRLSENFKEIMSRSYKKTISFGKSDNGGMTRCKKTYGDFMAEKARKEGKPIHRQHHRRKLQTLNDYIEYVAHHFRMGTPLNDMYDRRRYRDYMHFLDGRKETEDLILEYAIKLFRKDKAK